MTNWEIVLQHSSYRFPENVIHGKNIILVNQVRF